MHGPIYGLKNGWLRDLDCFIGPGAGDFQQKAAE